jgi:hypothetical protein
MDDQASKLGRSRLPALAPEFAYARGFYAQSPFSGVLSLLVRTAYDMNSRKTRSLFFVKALLPETEIVTV